MDPVSGEKLVTVRDASHRLGPAIQTKDDGIFIHFRAMLQALGQL